MIKPLQKEINCFVCKKLFTQKTRINKICSKECRIKFYERKGNTDIAKASVGSISEMKICCEMLKRGYSVFRTVSQSSFCDVIAIKDNEILQIEVRTGYRDLENRISFPKTIHNKISTPTHWGLYIAKEDMVVIKEISKLEIDKYSLV